MNRTTMNSAGTDLSQTGFEGPVDVGIVILLRAEFEQMSSTSEYGAEGSISAREGFIYSELLLEVRAAVSYQLSAGKGKIAVKDLDQVLDGSRKVRRRSETTLKWAAEFGQASLLALAVNHLALGRSCLLESQLSRSKSGRADNNTLTKARAYLDDSVSLSRQIETALERCRLALALGDHDAARLKLEEAETLIEKTEKAYRPHQTDWNEWEPPEHIGVFLEGEIVGYHRRNEEIAVLRSRLERPSKDN